jgi:N utilization substance protein A
MILDLTMAVNELHQDKGISEELIISTIEIALAKAYEKYYGTTENLVIRMEEDLILSIFSKKEVVEEVKDDLFEISLTEAGTINEDAEVGDTMLVPCNPEEFGRIAIHTAKQIVLQRLKEIEKNTIYSDFKTKEGELIIGYIQRRKMDTLYLDLGNYEGILPAKNQASHENYQIGDRLKTLVEEVKQNHKGNVSIILTRTSTEFIKRLMEIEIPEIYDNTIQIFKIVREPGYRTKIAVYSNRDEIDPVGACVGQKGNRIQNIIKEIEGEKIDILKWSIDIKQFITNALIPAKVHDVIIVDETDKKAVAIVDDQNLSFAIGKKGLNIRLANRLTDWSIDVKTAEQAKELNIIADHVQEAEQLFREDIADNQIDELELPYNIKEVLVKNEILTIEQLVELTIEQMQAFEGMNEADAGFLKNFIDENYEVVVDDEATEEVEEKGEVEGDVVYYECPNCGANITEDQAACPSCGIEISFEEVEEEVEEEVQESEESKVEEVAESE